MLKDILKRQEPQAKRKVVEFRDWDGEQAVGEQSESIFFVKVNLLMLSEHQKEKVFKVLLSDTVSGVGDATHGQHNRLRAPGSIGACSTPLEYLKE